MHLGPCPGPGGSSHLPAAIQHRLREHCLSRRNDFFFLLFKAKDEHFGGVKSVTTQSYLCVIEISFSHLTTQTYLFKSNWHLQTQADLPSHPATWPDSDRHWGYCLSITLTPQKHFTLLPSGTSDLSPCSRLPFLTQSLSTLASPPLGQEVCT